MFIVGSPATIRSALWVIDIAMKIRIGSLRRLVREALGAAAQDEAEYEGAGCSECGGGMYEADEPGCEGMMKCASCGAMEDVGC